MRKLLVLTVSLIGLAACQPSPPSYSVTDPKTGEKVAVTIDEGSSSNTITFKSGEGEGSISVSGEGKAPQNMPAYIPAYPGAVYQGAFASASTDTGKAGGDVAGGMVSFQTKDPIDKVLTFYKTAFTRAGMTEKASGDMGGMKMVSFSKGNNEDEGAQIMASPAENGQNQFQIIYATAP